MCAGIDEIFSTRDPVVQFAEIPDGQSCLILRVGDCKKIESEENDDIDKHKRHNEYEDSLAGDKMCERIYLFSGAYLKYVATKKCALTTNEYCRYDA